MQCAKVVEQTIVKIHKKKDPVDDNNFSKLHLKNNDNGNSDKKTKTEIKNKIELKKTC